MIQKKFIVRILYAWNTFVAWKSIASSITLFLKKQKKCIETRILYTQIYNGRTGFIVYKLIHIRSVEQRKQANFQKQYFTNQPAISVVYVTISQFTVLKPNKHTGALTALVWNGTKCFIVEIYVSIVLKNSKWKRKEKTLGSQSDTTTVN